MTQPLPTRVRLVRDIIDASFKPEAAKTVRVGEYPHSPSVIVTTTNPGLIPDLQALRPGVPMAVYWHRPYPLYNGDSA